MFKAVAALAGCMMMTATAQAQVETTNWQVVANYRQDGPMSCQVRVSTPKDGPTLTIEGRKANNSTIPSGFVAIGGLKALLATERDYVRDISVSIGAWKANGILGNWTKGDLADNSRFTFFTGNSVADTLAALAGADSVTVRVVIGGKKQLYTFPIAGAAEPLRAMDACLKL